MTQAGRDWKRGEGRGRACQPSEKLGEMRSGFSPRASTGASSAQTLT